jgi:ketosteroid isomerase-like protein
MSKNLDTLRQGYKNFSKGDIPALLAVFDPNIEWIEPENYPYGETHKGRENIVNEVFSKLRDEFDNFQAAPAEFIDAGDRVIVLGDYSGSFKATGKSFQCRFAHVWTIQDGVAKKMTIYTDASRILDAMHA